MKFPTHISEVAKSPLTRSGKESKDTLEVVKMQRKLKDIHL